MQSAVASVLIGSESRLDLFFDAFARVSALELRSKTL